MSPRAKELPLVVRMMLAANAREGWRPTRPYFTHWVRRIPDRLTAVASWEIEPTSGAIFEETY
jgi:hypothetical protein